MMQDQQPAVIFKNKNVRGVRFGAIDSIAVGRGSTFQARNPGRRSLNFDRDFRHVDAHQRVGVSKHLFPTRTDIFPAGEPHLAGMNADGAGIGRPHLIHEIDIEAFQGEVELKIRLNDLFRIGHQEEWFITNLGGV